MPARFPRALWMRRFYTNWGVWMYSAIKYSIFLTFVAFSMVSYTLGAVMPLIIEKFGLTLSQGGIITFASAVVSLFFSIPFGIFSDKYGKKAALLLGIAALFFGSIAFYLSAGFYSVLFSVILIGSAVVLIIVGASPLVEDISKKGEYAKNLNITHMFVGIGASISPLLVGFLLGNGYDWRAVYAIFAALIIPLFFITLKSSAPPHKAERRFDGKILFEKIRDKRLMSYAVGLLLYVGTESGIATWMLVFLKNARGISVESGVVFLSLFLALLAAGRYVGGQLAHKKTPAKILFIFSFGAIFSLASALFFGGIISVYSMPLIGFFLSVMYPTLFSFAIESTENNKGTVSGMIVSISGIGAVIPYIMGVIGDIYGISAAFSILFVPLAYILLVARASDERIKRKSESF